MHQSQEFAVTTFYRFHPLTNERIKELQKELQDFGDKLELGGSILISTEGVNSTIAGSASAIASIKQFLDQTPEFSKMEYKDSYCARMPFRRYKVQHREELISFRQGRLVPEEELNHHISPERWHELLQQDVTILDTRNKYETRIGTFRGAIDPDIDTFEEFVDFLDSKDLPKDKITLIFCTGGIRCEKAILEMQDRGFDKVYQLQGGILKYMEEYQEESLFDGECFVFDHRVSVDKDLKPSQRYHLCPHCSDPTDVKISCNHCHKEGFVCHSCQRRGENYVTCCKPCRSYYEGQKHRNKQPS